MNLAQMIGQIQREAVQARRQSFQHGIIITYEQGLYKVNVSGSTYAAESVTGDRFLTGDRVYLALGRGTPRILGLLGKDENSL